MLLLPLLLFKSYRKDEVSTKVIPILKLTILLVEWQCVINAYLTLLLMLVVFIGV